MMDLFLKISEMKELQDLGVDTENSEYFWYEDLYNGNRIILKSDDLFKDYPDIQLKRLIGAFCLEDILGKLPEIYYNQTRYIPIIYPSGPRWVCDYHESCDFRKTYQPEGIDFMTCQDTSLKAAFEMLKKTYKNDSQRTK